MHEVTSDMDFAFNTLLPIQLVTNNWWHILLGNCLLVAYRKIKCAERATYINTKNVGCAGYIVVVSVCTRSLINWSMQRVTKIVYMNIGMINYLSDRFPKCSTCRLEWQVLSRVFRQWWRAELIAKTLRCVWLLQLQPRYQPSLLWTATAAPHPDSLRSLW